MPMVNPDEFVEFSAADAELPAAPIPTKQTAALLEKMLVFYGRIAEAGQNDEGYRQRLAEAHHFVCVRHGRNTWPMALDWRRSPSGWQKIEAPWFMADVDLAAYRACTGLVRDSGPAARGREARAAYVAATGAAGSA